MSRYAVDKVLWLLSHREDPLLFQRFMADPSSVLKDFDLIPEERKALVDCDIGELYSKGAQPFLLLAWSRRVAAARGEDGDEFVKRYIAAVKPHGVPDYST